MRPHATPPLPGLRAQPDARCAVLASWVLQLLFTVPVAYNEVVEHGGQFAWKEMWPEFWKDTFENCQSEFLQLLTFVVLTSFLVHKGSHESKDSDEPHGGQDRRAPG